MLRRRQGVVGIRRTLYSSVKAIESLLVVINAREAPVLELLRGRVRRINEIPRHVREVVPYDFRHDLAIKKDGAYMQSQ